MQRPSKNMVNIAQRLHMLIENFLASALIHVFIPFHSLRAVIKQKTTHVNAGKKKLRGGWKIMKSFCVALSRFLNYQ
jgi:hypothetical protein